MKDIFFSLKTKFMKHYILVKLLHLGFSSNSQMSLDNWSEFSAEKQNVDDLKSVILSRVQTVNASVDASLDNPRPPFHRFVQTALEQTENLLDEKYAELFGDRSEISMDVL